MNRISIYCILFSGFITIPGFGQNWDWVTKVSANGSEYVWDIEHDSQDNVIVTGRFKGNVTFFGTSPYSISTPPFGPDTDMFLVKYDKNGVLLWGHRLGGAEADWGRSLSVDSNDNIYLTGDFVNEAYFGDDTLIGYDNGTTSAATQARTGFVAKYTPDGDVVWVNKFQGGDRCRGYGISVDENGNAYVTGVIQGLTVFDSITTGEANTIIFGFVAKYNPDGVCIWANYFDSPYGSQGNDVQVVDNEHIVCTGYYRYQLGYDSYVTSGASTTWGDYFLMQIDSSGNFVWNVKGTGTYLIQGFNMAVGENKDIYVTGHFANAMNLGDTVMTSLGTGTTTSQINARNDGFIARYDSLGNRIWIRQLGCKLKVETEGIALIDNKYPVVSGYMEDTIYDSSTQDTILPVPGYETGFVIGYDENGVKQWHKIVQAGGSPYVASYNAIQGNTAYSVDVDNNNNILVGGLFGDWAYWDTTFVDAYGGTTDGFIAKMFPPLMTYVTTEGDSCIGDTMQFAGSAFGAPLTYSWTSLNNNMVYQNLDSMLLEAITTQQDTVLFIVSNGYVTDTAEFVIAFNALPSVNLGADYAICDLSDTLDAGGQGLWYDWGTGSNFNDSLLLIAASGAYGVAVTNSFGCTSFDTVTVTFNTNPSVDLGADYSICGSSDTLDAGGSELWYNWGTGSVLNDSLFIVSTSGLYGVTVTNSFGCTAADSVSVNLNAFPVIDLGADYSSCQQTDTLDAGGSGYWYNWGSGPVFNDSLLIITVSGSYSVEVTDGQGCITQDTVSVVLDACAGLADHQHDLFQIYPNPVSDILYVHFFTETYSDNLYYELYDIAGRLARGGPLNITGGVEVSSLQPGQYVIQIRSTEMFLGRFMVTKN